MMCYGVFQSALFGLLVSHDCCFAVLSRLTVAQYDVWCVSVCSVGSFGES